jgi:hypothetical protein
LLSKHFGARLMVRAASAFSYARINHSRAIFSGVQLMKTNRVSHHSGHRHAAVPASALVSNVTTAFNRRRWLRAAEIKLAFAIVFCVAPCVGTEGARAASLVVMAVNTSAIAGAKVFTIGVQVTNADMTSGERGSDAVLAVQNVSFTGGPNGPIDGTGISNAPDIQTVQTEFIDVAAGNNPQPPGNNAGPPTALSASGTTALYRDSWWYANGSGRLLGVRDSTGAAGPLTTNPAADGSGIYTLGLVNNVGINGDLFTNVVTTPFDAKTGETTSFTGYYGPVGANLLDLAPLKNLFANGLFTVPLAQIVATGDIAIPSDYNSGIGTVISLGLLEFNVLGGPVQVDPHAILDYNTGTIHGTPEPSTIVLAVMGIVALVACKKWRVVKSECRRAVAQPSRVVVESW